MNLPKFTKTKTRTANTPEPEHPLFGKVIYTYSRKQALEDGLQVEVTETAKEAGITFRTFMNRTVWDLHVAVPAGVHCQDERGRLWDILWLLRFAIRRHADQSRLPFELHVRNNNRRAKLVSLVATCGPVDHDDPAPAITIMLPDED